jgi:hypothetical protein
LIGLFCEQDVGPSIDTAYESLAGVSQVVDAIRKMEGCAAAAAAARAARPEELALLQLLQKKGAVYGSYMQHLYLYGLLKVFSVFVLGGLQRVTCIYIALGPSRWLGFLIVGCVVVLG